MDERTTTIRKKYHYDAIKSYVYTKTLIFI
nr:MAG TPA: hypothetical protein [Caudoviricetes sp.]